MVFESYDAELLDHSLGYYFAEFAGVEKVLGSITQEHSDLDYALFNKRQEPNIKRVNELKSIKEEYANLDAYLTLKNAAPPSPAVAQEAISISLSKAEKKTEFQSRIDAMSSQALVAMYNDKVSPATGLLVEEDVRLRGEIAGLKADVTVDNSAIIKDKEVRLADVQNEKGYVVVELKLIKKKKAEISGTGTPPTGGLKAWLL